MAQNVFIGRSTCMRPWCTLFVLLLIFTSPCFGQSKKEISGDTTFWFGQQKDDSSKFGLSNLMTSQYPFHFRFCTAGHIIDIWTADGKVYKGNLLIYTFGYKEQKDGGGYTPFTGPLYDTIAPLDSNSARRAYGLIKSVSIIPSQNAIKGWQNGDDGVEYILQSSTPSTFNFRSYWTPSAQDSTLIEAKMIEKFVSDLDSVTSFKSTYREFRAALKPGQYEDGSGMIMIKLTPEQNAYYNRTKPYRDYLDSLRGRLNKYLSETLTRSLENQGLHPSFCELFLKFSTENKLIKIKPAVELSNSKDRKNFRLCKKGITDAFRSIEVNFVHSQLAYWKEVQIGSDGIVVKDISDYFAEPVVSK